MAAQRDAVREWREQYARYCHHIDFEPIADTPFHHSVKPIFDEPRLVRTTLSPGFLFRDDDLVRDGDNGVSLVIAQSGKLDIMHRGREVQLRPGEATVMQADAPGRCGSHKGFVVSEFMILPAEWEIRGGNPGDALMQRMLSVNLKAARNHFRRFPLRWLRQPFWPQRQVEPSFVWMANYPTEAFSNALCVSSRRRFRVSWLAYAGVSPCRITRYRVEPSAACLRAPQ
jgi:hypothetical protein